MIGCRSQRNSAWKSPELILCGSLLQLRSFSWVGWVALMAKVDWPAAQLCWKSRVAHRESFLLVPPRWSSPAGLGFCSGCQQAPGKTSSRTDLSHAPLRDLLSCQGPAAVVSFWMTFWLQHLKWGYLDKIKNQRIWSHMNYHSGLAEAKPAKLKQLTGRRVFQPASQHKLLARSGPISRTALRLSDFCY